MLIVAQANGLYGSSQNLHPGGGKGKPMWLRKHLAANYWIDLRGHRDDRNELGATEDTKGELGWKGEKVAKAMGVFVVETGVAQ